MPTKPKATPKAAPESKEHHPLAEGIRRIFLASIGVVALTMDEVEDLVDKFVERGELAEKDGKKLLDEMMEKRKARFGKTEEQFNKHLEEVLGRMNVPNKADIEALSTKIDGLTARVDGLKKT